MRAFAQRPELARHGLPVRSILPHRPGPAVDSGPQRHHPAIQRSAETNPRGVAAAMGANAMSGAGHDFTRIPVLPVTRAAAACGLEGASRRLPHLDLIQVAFGHHDLAGVTAHTHWWAAQALGARSYTMGEHVVFGGAPALHTAAHEAAHVVQQRAGVNLEQGMGQEGDVYERHADRVAGAVVAGRSAERLLDAIPRGTGSAGGALQRQPAAAQAASKESGQQEAAPSGEAERLRLAILAAAEGWLAGENFISQQKIDDIRNGIVRVPIATAPDGSTITMAVQMNTPLKNYTTCVEFAGQVFSDAVRATHKGDRKGIMQRAPMLAGILTLFNEEVGLKATIEAFRKSLELFVKPEGRLEGQRAEKAAGIEELKGKKSLDLKETQQLKANQMGLKQIETAIRQVAREKAKIEAKIEKLEEKLAGVQAKDKAWIKAAPGLPGGRPKPGEFVLFGQPPGQTTYGVSKETTVSLPPGSFKHISTFRRMEKLDEGMERWNTIDGGGTHAKEQNYYVRTTDLLIFASIPKDKKTWPAPQYMLLGWIDIETLVGEGKTGAAKSEEAKPPAP